MTDPAYCTRCHREAEAGELHCSVCLEEILIEETDADLSEEPPEA